MAQDKDDIANFDWPAYFFDERHRMPQRLNAAARKRFGDTADAEAAYNYALDAVSAEDWSRLRKGYRGRGRPDGFLAITFANLMEEYAVKKYGRRRPPKWVRDLGGMWPRIFEMLCLRRLLPETIVDAVSDGVAVVAAEARRAIAMVRAKIPNCGQYTGEINVESEAAEDSAPPGELAAGEFRLLCEVLGDVFPSQAPPVPDSLDAVSAAGESRLNALRDALDVDDEDRLILKLVYMDGQSIAKTARTLKLREHTVRRKHRRLLDTLRAELDRHGVRAAATG